MNKDFEKYMSEFVNVNEVDLYRIIKYQLGWEDEFGKDSTSRGDINRVYSSIVLEICSAFSDDIKPSYQFATSIEILANSWYVHEDVQSGITERNGRSSVWWAWGPAQGINTGDGLHALARLSLLENNSKFNEIILLKALSIFDSSYLTLCEGENLDIDYQEAPLVSEEKFMNMLKKRSGSLASCAFQFGYIASDAKIHNISEKKLGIIKELGEISGITRELNSQNLIIDSENLPTEIFHKFSSKKKNIITTYLLNNSDISTKRKIGEMYLKRVLEVDDLEALKKEALASDYKNYFSNLMGDYRSRSLEIVNGLGLSDNQNKKILTIVFPNESF
ncbi:MAG: polyprenyl synthetase family protein [Chloroflexota bacterium]|nr:polyprenyl synthetase family protein [Chloroflexota bacterium]